MSSILAGWVNPWNTSSASCSPPGPEWMCKVEVQGWRCRVEVKVQGERCRVEVRIPESCLVGRGWEL